MTKHPIFSRQRPDDINQDIDKRLNQVSRVVNTGFKWFGLVWIINIVVAAGLTSFLVWAIYRLVMHVTGG